MKCQEPFKQNTVPSLVRPVKLWFDPKQIATETMSPVLIQEISPEYHIKNIIRGKGQNMLISLIS